MLFHIIVGFILPWIVGVYLFKKQKKLFIIFYPIGAATSFLINEIGFNYFWRMDKTFEELSLASVPYDLGLYPILCCLFICTIHYKKIPILITFLVFTFEITFAEFIAVLLEKLVYRNKWNIIWSGVSYLTSFFIVYVYYKLVRKFIYVN
jgi:prepilin signal peptidase PulO-like enzyme (type II secretory pathway)